MSAIVVPLIVAMTGLLIAVMERNHRRLHAEIARVDAGMASMRTEVRADINDLRADIRHLNGRIDQLFVPRTG